MRRLVVVGAIGAMLSAAISTALAAPADGPVPPGTRATSVTFVSAQEGFILGTAPCAHPPCSVILRTRNRGASWAGLPAPLERISRPGGNGLWGLRFADADRGYAYGEGLWTTSNGAASWQPATAPARYVLELAAVNDRELVAVAAPCSFGSANCAGNLSLYHRSIGAGPWTRVATAGPQVFTESLAVHGNTVWALMGSRLLVSTDGGSTFSSHAQPCAHTAFGLPFPTSITDEVAGTHTYLFCEGQAATGHTQKFIYRTSGTSGAWQAVGQAPTGGDGGVLAAGSDSSIVLATASGASSLDRSADGGQHWGSPLSYGDGGEGWADLGFTTASDAMVIHGPAGFGAGLPGKLLLSQDAGRHWQTVTF